MLSNTTRLNVLCCCPFKFFMTVFFLYGFKYKHARQSIIILFSLSRLLNQWQCEQGAQHSETLTKCVICLFQASQKNGHGEVRVFKFSLKVAWPFYLFISLKLILILTDLVFDHVFCRKIEIVQFASRTRQLFVRLLALVKWASNAGKVEKCAVSWMEISFHKIRLCGWASIVWATIRHQYPHQYVFPSFLHLHGDRWSPAFWISRPSCLWTQQTD